MSDRVLNASLHKVNIVIYLWPETLIEFDHVFLLKLEAATGGALLRKKMFLKILQISLENTCVGVS